MSNLRCLYRVSLVLWLAAVIAILLWAVPDGETPEQQSQHTHEYTYEYTHTETAQPVSAPPNGPETNTPVREDIPLDANTQLLLYQASDETGIPHELALAVTWRETTFRNVWGDGGASAGYMQVQQQWHQERMERLGVTDLADPYSNFLVGCDYLAELINENRGLEWALHAYNGGPNYANNMAKAEKVSQYVNDVINYMNELEESKNGNMEF